MNNSKTIYIVLSIIIVVIIFLFYEIYSVKNIIILQKKHFNSILIKKDSIYKNFENDLNNLSQKNISLFKDSLNLIEKNKLDKYQTKLEKLQEEIKATEKKSKKLKENYKRRKKGLPELVTLDELGEKYDSYNSPVSFKTGKGIISFTSWNIDVVKIPESKEVAWIQIGKKEVTENSELIKAWLSESTNSKIKQGYKLIYNRTRNSDYGEYTEKYYKKGDLYFKSYYQYERVLQTYGRHSLRYTFYIEIGSTSRKKEYEFYQYNSKIGS